MPKKQILNFIITTILVILSITSCEKNANKTNNKKETVKIVKKIKKAEFILKFSHVVSEDTPKGKAARFFENRLETLSKGRIDVQVYPNSELYKDSEVLKAIKSNSVQMACPSFSKFSKTVPQLALFDLPFLFKDMNHLHKVQDSKVGEKLKKMVEADGVVALSFWDNSFKQLTSSKNSLVNPADIKGQKFRIMNSEVLKAQFEILGAKPLVMPFSKVFMGLKEGVIDGQENTISNIYTKKFYTVQKYLTISNHGYLGYLVVMSKEFYNSLPTDLQKNVKQAIKEATEKERIYAGDFEIIQLTKIKHAGTIEITELSKEQINQWREAVKDIYKQFYDKNKIGRILIQDVTDLR